MAEVRVVLLGIVVVNYQQPQGAITVARAATADAASHGVRHHCIMIDNSGDIPLGALQGTENCEIIALDNPGYAAALNTAMRRVDATHFLFLTHEVVWQPGNISYLMEPFDDPLVAATGPVLLAKADGHTWSAGCRDVRGFPRHTTVVPHSPKVYSVTGIDGCAWMVSSRAVAMVGWLSEDYFLYWEETDWQRRAQQAGLKIVVATKATASCSPNPAPSMAYYLERNKCIYAERYLSRRVALRCALAQMVYYAPRELLIGLIQPSRRLERMTRARSRWGAALAWFRGRSGKR